MPLSSWWVGSFPDLPTQTISVTANAVTEDLDIAAGSYYVAHHSGPLSLCEALETALETHSEITTATVILSRDRLVRVTCDVAFTLTWTDTEARDVLGCANFGVSQTTQVAPNVSPYLWVPDRPADPSARLGRDGDTVYDTVVSQSGGSPANIVATQHDERTYNTFDVRFIRSQYFDSGVGSIGGEYRTFFDTVLRRLRRFALYRDTLHDEADTTSVGLINGNHLGPYRMVPGDGPIGFANRLELPYVVRLHRATVSVVQTSEYT